MVFRVSDRKRSVHGVSDSLHISLLEGLEFLFDFQAFLTHSLLSWASSNGLQVGMRRNSAFGSKSAT